MALASQKLLTSLLMPLGTAFLLGIVALSAALFARRRISVGAGVAALVWLWFWSTPFVSDWIRGTLERQVPAVTVDALPSADAILVLGGGISGAMMPWRPYPDMNSAGDRVWHAARLFQARKAPRIVLVGGTGFSSPPTGDEATAMAVLLSDLGVPRTALVLETQSRTTTENAARSAEILTGLNLRRVLLVTSALHMPRALLTFRSRAIDVIPASTDVEVVPTPLTPVRWLPDASALDGSTDAIHEVLGIARCRLIGC